MFFNGDTNKEGGYQARITALDILIILLLPSEISGLVREHLSRKPNSAKSLDLQKDLQGYFRYLNVQPPVYIYIWVCLIYPQTTSFSVEK